MNPRINVLSGIVGVKKLICILFAGAVVCGLAKFELYDPLVRTTKTWETRHRLELRMTELDQVARMTAQVVEVSMGQLAVVGMPGKIIRDGKDCAAYIGGVWHATGEFQGHVSGWYEPTVEPGPGAECANGTPFRMSVDLFLKQNAAYIRLRSACPRGRLQIEVQGCFRYLRFVLQHAS